MTSALHAGAPVAPHDVWTTMPDPLGVVWLAVVAAIGIRGYRRLGALRSNRSAHRAEILAFSLAMLFLVLALASPIDAAGSSLLSAHMIQHELLIAVAAPLLILANPIATAAHALPPTFALRIGRATRSIRYLANAPLHAALLHAIAIWAWHAPVLHDLAQASSMLHGLQHASFFITALLFWHAVLERGSLVASMVAIFITILHTTILGALLYFSTAPWYTSYLAGAPLWGMDALTDQQTAGLIMWMPGAVAYVVVALYRLHFALHDDQPRRLSEVRIS